MLICQDARRIWDLSVAHFWSPSASCHYLPMWMDCQPQGLYSLRFPWPKSETKRPLWLELLSKYSMLANYDTRALEMATSRLRTDGGQHHTLQGRPPDNQGWIQYTLVAASRHSHLALPGSRRRLLMAQRGLLSSALRSWYAGHMTSSLSVESKSLHTDREVNFDI